MGSKSPGGRMEEEKEDLDASREVVPRLLFGVPLRKFESRSLKVQGLWRGIN